MYSCETWALRKSEQNKFLIFERKVLRRIFGLCLYENIGEWRIRKNEELRQLYQMPDIIRKTKKRRLQWTCIEKERMLVLVEGEGEGTFNYLS